MLDDEGDEDVDGFSRSPLSRSPMSRGLAIDWLWLGGGVTMTWNWRVRRGGMEKKINTHRKYKPNLYKQRRNRKKKKKKKKCDNNKIIAPNSYGAQLLIAFRLFIEEVHHVGLDIRIEVVVFDVPVDLTQEVVLHNLQQATVRGGRRILLRVFLATSRQKQ
jgi:hypothetical protein